MPGRVYKIVAFVVFLFLFSWCGYAQSGSPYVNAGPNVTLACGTACTTLHASAFPSGATNSYNVSPIAYNPYSYNAGTPVLVRADDTFSYVINLPFTFCFFGNAYNTICIGTNNVISFNDSNALRYNNYEINTTAPSPGNIPPDIQNCIMGPWQDLDLSYQGNWYYQVVGTAPSRMFIVSWDTVPYYGADGSIDPIYCPGVLNATGQIILYETSNVIDINIQTKDTCPEWNGGKAIEGILNATGTVAYTVPGRNDAKWVAQNDAWRFTPNDSTTPVYDITWYQGDSLLGTGDSIQVCPNAALNTTYTARAAFTTCGNTPVLLSDSVVVSLTGTLIGYIDSSHNVTCNGKGNGIAWASSSGGAIPVSFSWSNITTHTLLSNTLEAAGISPGTIVFTATDHNGCTRSDTTTITEPPAFGISLLSQTPTGCITNNGTVTVTGTGGTPWYVNSLPDYQYNWSNSVTGQVDTALGQGTVTVTVTDANGCTVSQSFTTQVTSSVFVNPIATNPLCFQSADGSIDANPTGGSPPYTFVWNNGDSKQIAVDLTAGSYSCSVSDTNGCSAVANATLVDPPQLTLGSLTSTPVKCQGESNGTITASPSGGTPPYFLSATPDGVTFTADSDGIMEGLTAGNYTVVLADNNGCTQTELINVQGATPDFFDVTVDSALCYGYSDGAAFIVDSSQQNRPYQYSIDSSGQFQYSSDFNNLSPGNHTITAINKNGCITQVPVVVPQPAPVLASVIPDTVILTLGQSQQVAVNYLNTTGLISFSWSPDFGLSCMDCADPIVAPYVSQDYMVTVGSLNQTATCYGYASLYVTVLPAPPFFIPNSFTPNNDGNNDRFEIYGESIKVVDMKIFNRWGELVFQTNDQFAGWDGTYKGQLQQPGVFSYHATITFLDGSQVQKSGSVTLLR